MLQELNFRKQLPVYVQYAHVNTTKDKKFVYELLDSGLSHEDAKIEFVPADSTSMDEQNVQVYRIIKRIQMFKKNPSLFVGSRSSNKSHLQQQNVLNTTQTCIYQEHYCHTMYATRFSLFFCKTHNFFDYMSNMTGVLQRWELLTRREKHCELTKS